MAISGGIGEVAHATDAAAASAADSEHAATDLTRMAADLRNLVEAFTY